jgi:UDP-glucose:(heptosyl)LPS alpha-1,3-glucosyltransferase
VVRFPWSFRSKRIEYGPNTIVNSALIRLAKRRLALDVVNTQGAELLGVDVITAHGTWWGHYRAHAAADPTLAAELRKSMMPLVERANYRGHRYRRIIAVSELARRELREIYNVANEDMDVIPEGVDSSRFRPDPALRRAWRSEMGLDGDLVLLHVTTDFLRKGLRTIIRALPRMEGAPRLVVVGREDPGPYREEARQLGVDGRLTFIPFAPRIEDCYAGADVFVFPSDYEAFGLALLEAMASGLPVVCTKGLGATDIMSDGRDALLLDRWDDPNELAEKVNSLGPEPRREMGAHARRTAEANPWERTAARTRAVYEACLRR